MHLPALRRLAPLLGALALAACGGSSDEPTVAITGSVFAAPVAGATVVARDAAAVAVSAAATTAADGTFTIDIPASKLTGPVFLEASGGTFTDEATGAATAGGSLAAYADGGTLAAGSALHLTPQSTVVARLVQHGKTLAEANAAFQAAFGFTPDPAVAPANVALPAAPAVPTAAELARAQAALRAAAFSQLAQDLGIPAAAQFTLVHELAHDAADGALDGQDDATQITVSGVDVPADVQNRYAAALMARQADATSNHTGLKVDQIGFPPFCRTALTASYRVEYVAGMMPAAIGKTRFQVRVTDRATGLPVAGLAPVLQPKMHMSTKSHASPTDPVVDAGGGLYDATVYYVMSTAMADGMSMGVWELGVRLGAETATFYPQVAMSMGDTRFVRLSGPAGSTDMIQSMPAPVKRTYQLFHDGLTLGMGGATFGLLVTTMDTMMSFPHISPGVTLHDGSGAAFDVGAVAVRVSSDAGATWVDAADLGDGHWSAAGLAGLTAGVAAPLRVELTVDGEVKATQDLSAAYATFTVTPAAMP